jgi:hypothetical protein
MYGFIETEVRQFDLQTSKRKLRFSIGDTMSSPAKLWIDALLSGKYKQIRSNLKSDKGHCCLGVLCEVYNENNEDKLLEEKFHDGFRYSFDKEFAYLPSKVIQWLTFSTKMRQWEIQTYVNGLAVRNDCGDTFEQIVSNIREFFKED